VNLLGPAYRVYKWWLKKQIKNGNSTPQHLGIILDGNRRFAREKGLDELWIGHRFGADKINAVLDWCWEANIKVVTIYAFSTENFSRPFLEVEEIMKIAIEKFEEILTNPKIHSRQVRVKAIGRVQQLPKSVQNSIKRAEEATKNYNKHFLNVAIGYGGRAELVDAFRNMATLVEQGQLEPEKVTEKTIELFLYTSGLPDPDLIIRTSGEERLSGFLLWQSAYSELYFAAVYWPEFRQIDLLRAIRTFQRRQRRFGV
jgi:tritrans,polycis-undecaprenyl-diphosphate synthase [geranylgeranyl-diphosphate specific]